MLRSPHFSISCSVPEEWVKLVRCLALLGFSIMLMLSALMIPVVLANDPINLTRFTEVKGSILYITPPIYIEIPVESSTYHLVIHIYPLSSRDTNFPPQPSYLHKYYLCRHHILLRQLIVHNMH